MLNGARRTVRDFFNHLVTGSIKDAGTVRATLLAILCAVLLLFFLLRKSRVIMPVVIFILGIALMVFEIAALTIHHVEPVEMSHISYFILGLALLTGIRELYLWAGVASLTSGAGFFVGGIFLTDFMVNGVVVYYKSIVSHSLLLFCGLFLLFGMTKMQKKDLIYASFGYVIVFLYEVIARYSGLYSFQNLNKYFFMHVIDGTVVNHYLFGNDNLHLGLQIAMPVLACAFFIGLCFLFYWLSNKVRRKGEAVVIGLVPLLKIIIRPIKEKHQKDSMFEL